MFELDFNYKKFEKPFKNAIFVIKLRFSFKKCLKYGETNHLLRGTGKWNAF
jgi:hypothetical protein